jgi:hypothetical protein
MGIIMEEALSTKMGLSKYRGSFSLLWAFEEIKRARVITTMDRFFIFINF